ncbi:hypothetical protein GCM10019017_05130 [Streptomyces showdoensis]
MKRARAFTIAAATSVALAAGMTGPATAITAHTTAAPDTARTAGKQRIPLVTGDRVVVDAKGRMVGFESAPGREHIPVRVQRTQGHTLVVPGDAERLITAGKLDQRLFDLDVLTDPRLRKSHRAGLKMIVQYEGGATAARAEVRAAGATPSARAFPTLNAEAVRASQDDLSGVWDALTDRQRSGLRATASGIGKVWLDGVRGASLDRSVRQIGADKAWESGYDGTGVKIAVLDTGVDKTHEDLKTQVVGEKNFSSSPDTVDRVGHGTHVASIAAGTGAKSGGLYKGVAPGAKVISGKVLDDEGFGDDSAVIAGMEWAAAEGADVVNLSLGSTDSPGIDPLEATVNRLTAEKGILFAIAAGNEGESGASSVGSPGSADAALTVGAVDKDDRLAPFSSTGPRVGDGAVKPDLTAPGVAITAAAAAGSAIDTRPGTPHPAPGYLQIDGTSMATPHVAGAAAILKQRHPDWKAAELKGALTASTKGGAYTAFQQGTGRVQVDKALGQSVIAEPVSLNYGTALWPHADDVPVSRKLAYRNLGTTDVTLDLSVATLDPAGKPAPAGFFALGASRVTVPAGGRAEVDLVADTRIGDADGTYSGYVTATAAGQSVRTAAVAVREAESYDVTLRAVDRDGADARNFASTLLGVGGPAAGFQIRIDQPGSHTIRVPKGSYTFDTAVYQDPSDYTKGTDWISQPKLEVTGDMTVVADARTTKPVEVTVPGIDRADYFGAYYERATEIGRGRQRLGPARLRRLPDHPPGPGRHRRLAAADLGRALPQGRHQPVLGGLRRPREHTRDRLHQAREGERTGHPEGRSRRLRPREVGPRLPVRAPAGRARGQRLLRAAAGAGDAHLLRLHRRRRPVAHQVRTGGRAGRVGLPGLRGQPGDGPAEALRVRPDVPGGLQHRRLRPAPGRAPGRLPHRSRPGHR